MRVPNTPGNKLHAISEANLWWFSKCMNFQSVWPTSIVCYYVWFIVCLIK